METSKICLDTDILIDTLTNNEDTVEYIKQLEQSGAVLSTTSVNSFELYYGAFKTKKKDRNVDACKALLRRLVLLDFTETASLKAGEILSQLEKVGRKLDFRDIFIASVAVVNGCSLATRNISHFNRVTGLNLTDVS